MSIGAEFSVVALPVGVRRSASEARGGVAAGIAVAVGSAAMGTGRLMLAAGSFARARLDGWADVCAGAYERLFCARANTGEHHAPALQLAVGSRQQRLAIELVAPSVAAQSVERLRELHTRQEQLLRQAERKSALAAVLQCYGPQLDPDLAEQASAALRGADAALLTTALVAVRAAVAHNGLDTLQKAQAALAVHRGEVAALIVRAVDTGLRIALSDWHTQIAPALAPRDLAGLREALRHGEQLLLEAHEQHVSSVYELRALELSGVWGLLEAVDAVLSDLALVDAVDATRLSDLRCKHKVVAAAFEQVATEPFNSRTQLRSAAAELGRSLEQLRDAGLRLLDTHYQNCVAGSIRECLVAMCLDQHEPFRRLKEELREDGTIQLVVTANGCRLSLGVHRDGQVRYAAEGFDEATCATTIFSLCARLKARGVLVEPADPQHAPQVAGAWRPSIKKCHEQNSRTAEPL